MTRNDLCIKNLGLSLSPSVSFFPRILSVNKQVADSYSILTHFQSPSSLDATQANFYRKLTSSPVQIASEHVRTRYNGSNSIKKNFSRFLRSLWLDGGYLVMNAPT